MSLTAASVLNEAAKYSVLIPEDMDAQAAAGRAADAALALLRDPSDAADGRLPYLALCILRHDISLWAPAEEYVKVGDVAVRGTAGAACAERALREALMSCRDIIKGGEHYFC